MQRSSSARWRFLAVVFTLATLFAGFGLPHAQTALAASSGNPILPGFQADPSVELFEGRYYIYPTGDGRYFHAYSSTDLTNWIDAGVVLDRATVSWASSDDRTWAPDMVARNGTYYFYFALATEVGVAVCDSPLGPCRDKGSPLVGAGDGGAEAIDPMVFIDDDSQAYLYYGGSAGGGRLGTYKLNSDMTSLNGSVSIQYPTNFTEGSFVFKRNGTYYLTYSNGAWYNASYNVQYATASSPLGPWNYKGSILSSDSTHQGPGHHSLLQYPGSDDWYVVYHRYQNNDFSGHRLVAIDRMYFNSNGTIRPIAMTDAGVDAREAPGVNRAETLRGRRRNHKSRHGAHCLLRRVRRQSSWLYRLRRQLCRVHPCVCAKGWHLRPDDSLWQRHGHATARTLSA